MIDRKFEVKIIIDGEVRDTRRVTATREGKAKTLAMMYTIIKNINGAFVDYEVTDHGEGEW